ncbi:MAG TPA: hypothetical protein VIL78_05690 [Hanamia sp.]
MNPAFKNTKEHLNFFISHIPPILQHFNKSDLNSAQGFSTGMLQRLFYASNSINKLIYEHDEYIINDFSIGIIVRSILLDSLIGLNFYKILKDNLHKSDKFLKIELNNFCNSVLSDGLRQTLDYYEQLKVEEVIKPEDLKNLYNVFSNKYNFFLEQSGGVGTKPNSKFKFFSKQKPPYKPIVSDAEMKGIALKLQELYNIYSKYDHFGILYFEIDDTSFESKSNRISASISLFVNHCTNLFDILQRVSINDNFVNSQYEIANNYLQKKIEYNNNEVINS